MVSSRWLMRFHDAAETVMWMVKLNAWWWLFTLLGLGVVGAAPATAAAAVLVRRRGVGEVPRLVDFARVYRAELVPANRAMAPGLAMVLLLGANLLWASGEVPGWLTIATVPAFVLAVVACCYLAPLYAFYDLPADRYLPQAVRVALCRPQWSALMALVTAAIVFGGSKVPALAVLAGVGVWLHTCTWLGLRLFAENEDRLRAAAEPSGRGAVRAASFLPAEPLRMH